MPTAFGGLHNTDDFMTADWSRLPYDLLATVSTQMQQAAGHD